MVWAAQHISETLFTLASFAFFAVWILLTGSFICFSCRVAPAALKRWAESEGFQIIKRNKAGMFGWYSFPYGTGHWVYRIVVEDKTGRQRGGLVRVGNPYTFCLSVNRRPAAVRWDKTPDDDPEKTESTLHALDEL